ncbi:MAG: tRNA (N6-isopentenyl adenosine(37)-C2)-methylthiotransferase MiaB [Nitrospirae bacterium]|nr:tRNA (N6-isopentenyl adenosine(37)-C2)-methylthiotransferase MiaB [Nitrospirota bacterium]
MTKYYISTFGCQMNVHDSEKIAGILKSEGYIETDCPQDADLVIFNTCSIRQKAEQKFFSELGRLKMLKKRKPGLRIAVAGCIAQQQGKKILKRVPYVDYVIGPQNIHMVRDLNKANFAKIAVEDNLLIADTELPVERKDQVRAWINIMYGCNNFCSYCIVPFTRGREQSRPSHSILNEIKELAHKGYREVTLLGQNVNSYASDKSFPELLKEVDKIEGIRRIRFVTSHPKDLSDELIIAIRDLEKVCEHIHLPLQSGSTRVLSLMNRKYTFDEYLKRVDALRRNVPGIAITSDIIAGFPEESVYDYGLTVKALHEIEFDGIFAFHYSKREGTKAAAMRGQIADSEKLSRLNEIIEIQNEITEGKNQSLNNSVQEILIDGPDEKNPLKMSGRTRGNKIVSVTLNAMHQPIKPGDVINVLIIKANRHSLEGEVIPE